MNPGLDTIKAYYDDRIDGKILDFVQANPRVEGALKTLVEWAPRSARRILEIGCGVGATTWRMSRIWPEAEVIGMDLSPRSLAVARKCFQNSNLSYREGRLAEGFLPGQFDYIVLMDVYEHIARPERPTFRAALKSLLAENGRIFLSFPTPLHLADLRIHAPKEIQPVDEDVTPECILHLAGTVTREILFYKVVGIWRYGDYAHAVIGRIPNLDPVMPRNPRSGALQFVRTTVKRLIRPRRASLEPVTNLLGPDEAAPGSSLARRIPALSRSVREQLVAAWRSQPKG